SVTGRSVGETPPASGLGVTGSDEEYIVKGSLGIRSERKGPVTVTCPPPAKGVGSAAIENRRSVAERTRSTAPVGLLGVPRSVGGDNGNTPPTRSFPNPRGISIRPASARQCPESSPACSSTIDGRPSQLAGDSASSQRATSDSASQSRIPPETRPS